MNKKVKSSFETRILRIAKLTNCNNQYYELEFIKDDEYKIEDHKEVIAAQKELGGFLMPNITICTDLTIISAEMLKYLSKNENDPYTTADGFVIKSIPQRILGNFYLKIIKPERPTRLFNNKEEAYKWIKQFY